MRMRLTVLGCGSSGGVPRIGNYWGLCDPNEPRNRRRRSSVLIEAVGASGSTRVLVDTSPDLREQLLDAGVGSLDAVLFTHDHADHTHGIDDLRVLAIAAKRRIPVYFDERTRVSLEARFSYCFRASTGSSYRPILESRTIVPGTSFAIKGAGGKISFLPFEQQHGDLGALGFRVDDVAFSSDISGIPEASRPALAGLQTWLVDALRYEPHPSHYSLDQALSAIAVVGARHGVLTHMHTDLDYQTLRRVLPAHVEPAYDGMVIEWDGGAGRAGER